MTMVGAMMIRNSPSKIKKHNLLKCNLLSQNSKNISPKSGIYCKGTTNASYSISCCLNIRSLFIQRIACSRLRKQSITMQWLLGQSDFSKFTIWRRRKRRRYYNVNIVKWQYFLFCKIILISYTEVRKIIEEHC